MSRYVLKEQLKKEKKIRSRLYLIFFLLLFMILAYNFFFGEMGYLKYRELKKNEQKILTEINQIKKTNDSIKHEINLLKKDPKYLEKYAKEQFGLIKPGEMIFQFQDSEK
ncbi:septum formation initiator family protein [Thermodesulfovibrio sp. 1176]|uniref:FtsB family cell division protein n=1 Tax=unclassified Thermodesulfovibrio TaxID=2645936 RepID=UPI00083B94E3|nr:MULTISPECIES: septum formation initiator family protein [unclassified Thermodesulfovibrio]MDI1472478.1 septum formation initiator family protein [Thermodesulfovibrio sp. 1176]